MESRAKAFGHAIHPMMIVFPFGLLATAVIFDILHLITGGDGFPVAAAYTMIVGVIGGVVAGVFGLVDWAAIPRETRAKRIGAVHGLGNVVVLALFAISWLFRLGEPGWTPPVAAWILGFVGLALALGTGWLGGELVERLGVGVDRDAGLNASSSLGRPVRHH